MNDIAIDILNVLSDYGITQDEDKFLIKLAENIDRAKLCRDIDSCKDCPICKSTSKKVTGEGPRSSLVIVGGYSSEMENATGRPFVGQYGQLFDKLLSDSCIDRNKIYLTNAVKCRPPYNRAPNINELSSCASKFLSKELDTVKPKHIIVMGELAASLFTSDSLDKMRGKTIELRGYPVTFTYHPSDILSIDKEQYSHMYNLVVDDLCKVVTLLFEDSDTSIVKELSDDEIKDIGF